MNTRQNMVSTANQVAQNERIANINPEQEQYKTGWWNTITGGNVEKSSAIAMSNVDRAYQTAEAKRQMDYQSREAQKNRDYQERLSSSAYQRATEDLKRAGLNPAMMYTHLGGSSTPSGSSPGGASGAGSRTTPPASNTGQLVSLIAGAVGAGVMATAKATSAIRVANMSFKERMMNAKW